MNQKKGLDYFPFDVDFFQDEKIQFVSARFGMKGEAVTLRLLCKIYRQGYYLNWNEDIALLFAKSVGDGCQHSLVNDVVNELLKRGFFHEGIFKRFAILTSKGIQRRYFEAASRRKNVEYDPRFLLVNLSKFKNVVSLHQNADIQDENVDILKQSKVEERKVKKSKVEERTATSGDDDRTVFSVFEKCGFQMTGYTADTLMEMTDTYSEEWVCEALKRAADRGKKTLGYVKGILNSWQTAGAMDEARPGKANPAQLSGNYVPEPNTPKKYVPPEEKKAATGMPEEMRKKWNRK